MTTPRTESPSREVEGRQGRGGAWSLLRWVLSSLVVAVVIGIATLPWILGSPSRVARIVAAAFPELEADVNLDGVRIGWVGPITLDGLRLMPRAGGKPPITVRKVEVGNGLAGILLSAGDLGRVRIEGFEADLVFDRDHRSNLDTILPPDDPARVDAPRRPRGPRRAAVRMRLEVEDAIVRITGPWASEAWVSDPVDLRATLANAADGYAAWTIEPVQLLSRAELTQPVAHEVLAYIVPVLADATRTSGRFSLRLDGARLPVGRPEQAEVAGLLAMHEVNLGPGPLVENMFRSMPLGLGPPPTVRITDESDVVFRLADRRVWHRGLEFGIPLKKPGQRLDVLSEGSVGLADRSLDLKLTLPIPADLPQDRPLVAALAGKQISLGVGGALGDPKVIFDGSIKAAAGEVLTDLIDRLRDGPRPQAPAAQPAPAAPPATSDGTAPPAPAWKPDADATAAEPARGDGGQRAGDAPATARERAAAMAEDAARKAGAEPGTGEAIVDIVGGVLDEVARRRAERRAAEAANPGQAPPPRRGRLLQRRPPPVETPPPAATPAP
ncbi:MAG: hypothetical protein ACKOC8_04170 [Pirellulales bacterium]